MANGDGKSIVEWRRRSARTWFVAPEWAALLIGCTAVFVSTEARAADPVPDKAGAFATYCTSHFADCKEKILETDIAVMAKRMFANAADQSCIIPKGIDRDSATRGIVDWLSKHRNVDAMNTGDGIQAAVRDLWHCQLQIGDGSVPGGPPAKTGAFVAYCPTHSVACANTMVAATVTVLAQDPPKHCLPPSTVKAIDMSAAVLGWLGKHTETYDLDTHEGIMAAFDQLWPCH